MNVVQKIKEFRVKEMDSSHVEKQYILSYNDRNFAINHNTKLLIDIVQDSEGPDELVENFCEVLHRDLSFDELELYPKSLKPSFPTAKRSHKYVLFFSRKRLSTR